MHEPRLGTVAPDDFRRIREVFESALEQPVAERQAFVEQACNGNTLLVAEVERMLAAEAGPDVLLDRGGTGGARAIGRCGSCHAELAASDRFCRACGTPTHGSGSDEGRFRAGALFANRFRIVARLGRGGMGEVYRADDLELGQPVALKFLTAFRSDERARTRLRNEVRLARQLAHPNVCRVYDIGEAHGELYLSMEYVDGEDLAALLTRIGRLPIDKGIEIARKLCAGLAAAHAKGVLHRDFKPANIMIDSRGEVRIMDFGLAAIASELDERDVRSGTPAYMAPEQLAGKEATKQSDLYALGLVLYELFTGKAAFETKDVEHLLRLRQSHPSTTPSTLIPDITPRLERIILKCLEPEPSLRPASALEVAASLPGGDPLAEALAAGETPSPEIVAAAGPTEGLRFTTAITLLACIAVVFAIGVWLAPLAQIVGRVPLKYPPEVLAERAREIIRAVGHSADAADWTAGFQNQVGWVQEVGKTMPANADRRQWAARLSRPPFPIAFWYRQADSPLVSPLSNQAWSGRVVRFESTAATRGDISVDLDLDGGLLRFIALGVSESGRSQTHVEWSVLFSAARLDLSRFTPTEPGSTVATADARMAWLGADESRSPTPIRIEAGAFHGRPVYLEVFYPWTAGSHPVSAARGTVNNRRVSARPLPVALLAWVLFPVTATVLAWRNWKTNRGDVRGAALVGLYIFSTFEFATLLGAHSPVLELANGEGLPLAMTAAVIAAICYFALEPWVRRRWPQTLITWSRVIAGRWRDPIVARDVLIAVLAAVLTNAIRHAVYLGFSPAGAPAEVNVIDSGGLRFTLDHLLGTRHIASAASFAMFGGFIQSVQMLFLIFLCRAALRNVWLSAAAYLGIIIALTLPINPQDMWIESLLLVAIASVAVVMLVRLGLLALAVWGSVGSLIERGLLTHEFGAWYGESSLIVVCVVGALALWAFRTSLGRRPVFAPAFDER